MPQIFLVTERVTARSNRAEVRNPILTSLVVARLRALGPGRCRWTGSERQR